MKPIIADSAFDDSTMPPRFFCPTTLTSDTLLTLPPAVAHHADRVLRLSAGDEIILFDGTGGEFPARILSLGKTAQVQLGGHIAIERESPLAVTLVQSLATGDKMDWVLQKAVELGAAAIAPVASQRSVVRLSAERAEKRTEHWRQVVISACEQCGRNQVPQVADLLPLPNHLAQSVAPGTLRLILAPGAGTTLSSLARPAAVHLLVGPEGGLTEAEQQAAIASGYRPITLGPRILRTETAGLAALAAIQTLWGDLNLTAG